MPARGFSQYGESLNPPRIVKCTAGLLWPGRVIHSR